MEYLHNETNLFKDVLALTSNKLHISEQIIEKDYYITIILKNLAQKLSFVVFKGGTSLSKCYQAIDRFSEDIDITTDIPLTQGQKQKLKTVIVDITNSLNLNISNINETRSRRDYNKYVIVYDSVIESLTTDLHSAIILETAYVTTSFPVNQRLVSNYIQQILQQEAPDLITKYSLDNYMMKVQSLERTFIDKIFAICDYYLQDKTTRHSRHLYDIYKLMPLLKFNNEFQKLVTDVRNERSKSPICISANTDTNINTILENIIQSKIYKDDYNKLTVQLLGENITYDETITSLKEIINHKIF